MTLPTPQGIIFDWDNTLVDTWPIIHLALNETLLAFGFEPWTLEQTRARVARSMRDSFPELFGESWKQAGELYQRHYRSHHLDMLQPMPGAAEVLEMLAKKELCMMVVSNKKGVSLRQEVEHLKWKKYFDCVVGADDAARDKPHADPVHLAVSQLERTAGPHLWFVGDSEVDLATAAASGCTPVLYGVHASAHPEFTPTHYQEYAYSAYAPDHVALKALFEAHL